MSGLGVDEHDREPGEQAARERETWVAIAWQDFIHLIESNSHPHHKAYYHHQHMRLEDMPTGSDHATVHAVLIFMIGLYAMSQGIPLSPKDACSFRKEGLEEFQPDIAYYIGDNAMQVPQGTRMIDLNHYPLPDLVIEISDTTLSDDLGGKRLQYEEIGILEYWIWNVKTGKIIAFANALDGSSRRIRTSSVLPNLSFDLLEEAMERSWRSHQSEVGKWLMQQMNAPGESSS
ncbi:MAG: Uma2 family endonuclease [Synechococcales bacterium]|nr:Uma2 family endonuclease [Synechococcales bacterium]